MSENEGPRRFSDAERRAYPAPRCPTCGAAATQEWVDAGDINNSGWYLGRIRCPRAKDHPQA